MALYYEYRIQLKDAVSAQSIIKAGGTCYVAQAGLPDKQALFDKTGASLANPLTPTRGFINFFTLNTSASVDLYVQAPDGQFQVFLGITPSGPNELVIRTDVKRQLAKIPFSIGDTAAATETATGFIVPDPSMFLDRLHGMGILVTALESGKTIDVGTAEAASAGGDADTFIAASSLTAAGLVIGTNGDAFSSNAPGTSTALIALNKNIVYTLSSGAAAAKGFILLPYVLC